MYKDINFKQHHAHMLVGDRGPLATEKQLLNMFCKENGCKFCFECKKILERRHHSIIWLKSEGQYNLDDIEIIFDTIKFQLEPDQNFFFVIENAENLNEHCANKILKTLEEPHEGYIFVLLTNNLDFIPVTIRSRCLITNINSDSKELVHAIVNFFKKENNMANEFADFLFKNSVDEKLTSKLLDEIIGYWLNKYKENPTEKNLDLLKILTDELHHLPMPGGSKMFWKNLYSKFQFRCLK